MTRKKIKQRPELRTPATGWITKAEIEKLLAKAKGAPAPPVTQLRRQDIELCAQGVFQWRDYKIDQRDKAQHIAGLMHALSITGKPLDALLVFPAGGRYFLIEGHHRLAAYDAVDWNDSIPVGTFVGTLDDACMAALDGNRKNKLPIARAEKWNAAWWLVQEGNLSKQAITDRGLVSRTMVRDMRQKLREIIAAGKDPSRMDWETARQWTPDGSGRDDTPNWREQKIAQLVERFVNTGLATELGHYPDIAAEALFQIAQSTCRAIINEADKDVLEEALAARQEDVTFDPNIDASQMLEF
jgi:hypothetical protein